MAPGDPVGARSAPRRRGARPGRRHRRVDRGAGPLRRPGGRRSTSRWACCGPARRRGRTATLLAGDALALPFAGRDVRRGDDLVRRCATSTTPRPRWPRWPASRSRAAALVICEFSHPTNGAVPARVPGLSDGARCPSVARKVVVQPGRVRLPGRVDPGVAGPGRAGREDGRRRAGQNVAWRNLTGGIVALHRATAGPDAPRSTVTSLCDAGSREQFYDCSADGLVKTFTNGDRA